MKREAIIRAWKDPEYRASLSTEQRAMLPESPSGTSLTELDDGRLREVVGGLSMVERQLLEHLSLWSCPGGF